MNPGRVGFSLSALSVETDAKRASLKAAMAGKMPAPREFVRADDLVG